MTLRVGPWSDDVGPSKSTTRDSRTRPIPSISASTSRPRLVVGSAAHSWTVLRMSNSSHVASSELDVSTSRESTRRLRDPPTDSSRFCGRRKLSGSRSESANRSLDLIAVSRGFRSVSNCFRCPETVSESCSESDGPLWCQETVFVRFRGPVVLFMSWSSWKTLTRSRSPGRSR